MDIPKEFKKIVKLNGKGLRLTYEIFTMISKKYCEEELKTIYSTMNPPGMAVEHLEAVGLLEREIDNSDLALGPRGGSIALKPTSEGSGLYKLCEQQN